MKRSEGVMLLARRFPFLFRRLVALSVQGYIPPIHRHWVFIALAAELFEEEGIPIWRSPYKLHIPHEVMDMYLNFYHYLDYEPMTRKVFLKSLSPGSVVIDVGANIGFYTLLAAGAVGPSGKVHAVECAPHNLRVLESNVEKEKLFNVQIHPCAASSARGYQKLNVSPVGLAGFSPSPRWPIVPGSGTTMNVPTLPLDDVIPSPVDLVKIDVDGFELEVLKGMERILAENKRLSVIVEWAPVMLSEDGRDPLELPTWLEDAGLRQITVLDPNDRRRCSLEETKQMLRGRRLPSGWGCNLFARRGSQPKGSNAQHQHRRDWLPVRFRGPWSILRCEPPI